MELLHKDVTHEIINAAIHVHQTLGVGLLESVYEECLCYEFRKRCIPHRRQPEISLIYEEVRLALGFRTDLIVRELVLVELKSVQTLHPIEEAKLINHLRLSGLRVGLLINFHTLHIKDGILRRVV